MNQPFDINQGAKLDMASSAKLRTLITYLQIVADLHAQYAWMQPEQLTEQPIASQDTLSRWALDYLKQAENRSLTAMLEAAMGRSYSANPDEAFFTGGGLHRFVNFHREDNAMVMDLWEATRNSVNLPFTRLMRDIVSHVIYRAPSTAAQILSDPKDPGRKDYLAKFGDEEGKLYLGPTSPVSRCSWPARHRITSPARRCPSTAASWQATHGRPRRRKGKPKRIAHRARHREGGPPGRIRSREKISRNDWVNTHCRVPSRGARCARSRSPPHRARNAPEGSLLEKESGQDQREPRDVRDHDEAEEQDHEVGRHVLGGLDDAELGDGAGDEQRHADARKEDADADGGDDQDAVMQRVDPELHGDGVHHRHEDDHGRKSFQHRAEDDADDVAQQQEKPRRAGDGRHELCHALGHALQGHHPGERGGRADEQHTHGRVDKTELALLRALEDDGGLSFGDLGEKAGLSKTACWSRVRELEKRGVIKGYRAEIVPGPIGLQIHAFVQVTINSVKHAEFENAVARHASVVQCFTTAGQADYLLHVLVPAIANLDELLRAEISRLPGVQRLVTTVCMKTIKHRAPTIGCLRCIGNSSYIAALRIRVCCD